MGCLLVTWVAEATHPHNGAVRLLVDSPSHKRLGWAGATADASATPLLEASTPPSVRIRDGSPAHRSLLLCGGQTRGPAVVVAARRLAHEERLLRRLDSTKWALAAASGYLGGQALAVFPGIKSLGFWGAVGEVFLATPIHVTFTLLALLAVGVWWPLRAWLHRRASRRTIDHELFSGFARHTDSSLKGHQLEGIAWGLGQTVLACPRPQLGWKTSEISFTVERYPYDFQALQAKMDGRELQGEFETFRTGEFTEQFTRDAERLMITKRPSAFTDNEGVRLAMRYTSWSRLQFFWQRLVSNETRARLVDMAFDDELIEFPNTLTLHLVVQTRDSKILLTQAHRLKANDYPESWACSLGEQLDPSDVANLSRDCAAVWVRRTLQEELSIYDEECDLNQTRFLALTLEADVINYAFICIAPVNLTAETLRARLSVSSREDVEFSDLAFIGVDEIPAELVSPSRKYHPSTPIRMIYTYIYLRGQNQLRQELQREFRKADSRA